MRACEYFYAHIGAARIVRGFTETLGALRELLEFHCGRLQQVHASIWTSVRRMTKPTMLTFDVFGTVVDWKAGLTAALAAEGVSLDAETFDRIVDCQGETEQAAPGRRYVEIAEQSLGKVLRLEKPVARRVAMTIGEWPPFADSSAALRSLMRSALCVAMTNSDRNHGTAVQRNLGFPLSHWICAEEAGCYKPELRFWRHAAERTGARFDKGWWHVIPIAPRAAIARSMAS